MNVPVERRPPSCCRLPPQLQNKFDHTDLDRHLGASLLSYLLDGEEPTLDARRASSSVELLFQDLTRLGLSHAKFERDRAVEVAGMGEFLAPILITLGDGRRVVLTLRVPFTSDVLYPQEWMDAADLSIDPQVIGVDELAIRSSLPRETNQLIDSIGLS